MKVKRIFISILLAALCLFPSCKNFFNSQDFLTSLDDAILYKNAQTYVIQVKAAEGTGTIIAGMGNNECKETDSFAIGFQKNTGYNFIEWRAVSKDDETTSRAECVSFKDKTALETKVTLVQGSDDILIIPVCDKVFKLEKALPEDSDSGVCCDSTIQLKFTYPLSDENDLSKIKIYEGSNDVTANFKSPKYEDDTLLIFTDTDNRISVAEGEKKTITVQIPEDFTYESDNGTFEIGKTVQHSYRINSDTTEKVQVSFAVVDESAGTLKLNDAVPSVYTFKYNIGESVEITYKLNDNMYFAGWECSNENAVLISPVTDDDTDDNGYNLSTKKVTLKMTILGESEDEVTVLLQGIEKDKCYVDISSEKGRFNSATSSTYRIGDSATLSFTADPDYQFLYWKVTNEKVKNAGDYIQIEDVENPNTTFVVQDIPGASVSFAIEPVCETRPKVVSATPLYDTDGVYRDRRITIMFDQKLDADSIYYTKDELIKEGVYDSSGKMNTAKYELLGNTKKTYGYKDLSTGDIVWKSLKISKLSDKSKNLLGCYEEPAFDEGNTGVLRISTKHDAAKMPPVSTDILVTIKKEIGIKAQINEKKYTTVGLSSVYSWSYFTNSKSDNDPPEIRDVELCIVKDGILTDEKTYPVSDASEDAGTIISGDVVYLADDTPAVDKYPSLNIYRNEENEDKNSTNLWLKASVFDSGSGPSSLTMKVYRIQDENKYYEDSAVITGADTKKTKVIPKPKVSTENLADPDFTFTTTLYVAGSIGSTSCYDATGNLKEGYGNLVKLVTDNVDNSLTKDGLYAVQLIATDKNDLTTVYEKMYYFLLDNTPPKASASVKEIRTATDTTLSWNKTKESDFVKTTIITEDVTEGLSDSEKTTIADVEFDTATTKTISGLTNQHKYKHTIKVYDVCNNVSEIEYVDIIPPDFTNVKFTETRASFDKAEIKWTNPDLTDLGKYSVAVYKKNGKKYDLVEKTASKIECVKNDKKTFKTEETIFGDADNPSKLDLVNQTKYKYAFTFYDFAGNASAPVEVEDNTAPDLSNVQFTETRTCAEKATITWTNPNLTDLGKYTVKVYKKNGKTYKAVKETASRIECLKSETKTFNTEETIFVDSNNPTPSKLDLVNLTKYKYEFTFYDFSGNASKVVPVEDNTPPKDVNYLTLYYNQANKMRLSWKNAADDVESALVSYGGLANNDYTLVTPDGCFAGAQDRFMNYIITDHHRNGKQYSYKVQVRDYSGNCSDGVSKKSAYYINSKGNFVYNNSEIDKTALTDVITKPTKYSVYTKDDTSLGLRNSNGDVSKTVNPQTTFIAPDGGDSARKPGAFDANRGSGVVNGAIELQPYAIGKYECVEGLVNTVMGTKSSSVYPKGNLTFYQIVQFCNALSILYGFEPCYILDNNTDVDTWSFNWSKSSSDYYNHLKCDFTKNGFRLPSDLEWENASRGGVQDRYEDGVFQWFAVFSGTKAKWSADKYWPDTSVGGLGSFGRVCYEHLAEAGVHIPNWLDIYDMAGNMHEFVWDACDNSGKVSTATIYGFGDNNNGISGPVGNNSRIIRGGYCGDSNTGSDVCNFRNYNRHGVTAHDQRPYVGFRLARTLGKDQ